MKKINILKSVLLGCALMFTASCGNDYELDDFRQPAAAPTQTTVTTSTVEAYGVLAKAGLIVNVAEGSQVDEAGFIFGTNPELSLTDESTQLVKVNGFTSGEEKAVALNDLEPGTTYYIKAYAYADGNLVCGEAKSITASDNFTREFYQTIDITDEGLGFIDFPNSGNNKMHVLDIAPLYGLPQPVLVQKLSIIDDGFSSIEFPAAEGAMVFPVDFTGVAFPAITVAADHMGAIFGSPANSGNYSVFISKDPINSVEDLAAATKIATYNFPQAGDEYEYSEKSFDIPFEFDGPCYIAIYSYSLYAANYAKLLSSVAGSKLVPNYGVLIEAVALSQLEEVEAAE